ncbi:hypothetical protein HDV04_001819, partial [Boothiomyces sp. JEL0838]
MSGPPKLPPRKNPIRSPPLPSRKLNSGSDNSDDDKPLFPKGIPDGSDSEDDSPLVKTNIPAQPQYNLQYSQGIPQYNQPAAQFNQRTVRDESSEDDAPLVQSTKDLMIDMNRLSQNPTPIQNRNLQMYSIANETKPDAKFDTFTYAHEQYQSSISPEKPGSPTASSDTPLQIQKQQFSDDDDVPLQIRNQENSAIGFNQPDLDDDVPLSALQKDADDDVPLSALQKDSEDHIPLRALQRDVDDDVPLSALRKPLPPTPKEPKDKKHKEKSPNSNNTSSNSGSDHRRKSRPQSYQPPQLNPEKKKHLSMSTDAKIPKYFNPDYLAPHQLQRPSSRATSGTESVISEASSYDFNPMVLPASFGNKPEFKAPYPVSTKKSKRASEVVSKPMKHDSRRDSISKTSKSGTDISSEKSSGFAREVFDSFNNDSQKKSPAKVIPKLPKSPTKENKRMLKENSSTESSDEEIVKKAPKIETNPVKQDSSGTESDDEKSPVLQKEIPTIKKMPSSSTEDSEPAKPIAKKSEKKKIKNESSGTEDSDVVEVKVDKKKVKKKEKKESSGTEDEDSDNESVGFEPVVQPFITLPTFNQPTENASSKNTKEVEQSVSLKSPTAIDRELPKVSLNFEPLDFDQDLDYFKAFVRSESRNTNRSKDNSDDELERRKKAISPGLEEFKKSKVLRKSRSVLDPSAKEYSKLKNELSIVSEEREKRLQRAASIEKVAPKKSSSEMSIDEPTIETKRASIHSRRSSLDPGSTIVKSPAKEDENKILGVNRTNSAMSIDEPKRQDSTESKKGKFARLDVQYDEFKTMRSTKSGGLKSAISTITFRSDSVDYTSDKEPFDDEPTATSPVVQKPSYMLETLSRSKSPEHANPSDSPSKVFSEMKLGSPEKGTPQRAASNQSTVSPPYPYPYPPHMPYPYPYPVPPPKDGESEASHPQQYPPFYPYPYLYPPAPGMTGADGNQSGQVPPQGYPYYPYPYPQFQPYPGQAPGQPLAQVQGHPQHQPSYPSMPGYPYYPPYPHQPPSHIFSGVSESNPPVGVPSYMPVGYQSPEQIKTEKEQVPVYRTNSINIKKFGPDRDLSFHTGNTLERMKSSKATISDFSFDEGRISEASLTDTDAETSPNSPQLTMDEVRPSFTTLNRRATLGATKLPVSNREFLARQKDALKNSTEPKELFEFAKLCLASGIEEYIDEGYVLLRKVANANTYPEANVFLGDSYADDKKDAAAFSQYLLAAKKNYSPVFYKLGKCYEEGKGCKKSKRVAIEMYNKATSSGDLDAMYRLGLAELEGTLGLKPDIHKAIKWFKRAAA